MKVLAVDAGRTGFRAAVFIDTRRGPSCQFDSAATLVEPDGAQRVASSVDAALRALGEDAVGGLDDIVIAAAGAFSRPDQAEALASALADRAIAGRSVVITSDAVAAHTGALSGQAGVVLSAGTGAVACAIDASGAMTLVDGAGFLLGDSGGGFAVGRAGLGAALRHHDGRSGGSAQLASLAEEQFGPLTALPGIVHAASAPARTVAGFVPAVAQAARDGDAVASAIWADAVAELAGTAIAASAALPERERRIAVAGSLFDLTDLVAEPFSATMAARAPGVSIRRTASDATTGAYRLADAPAGVYENLLLRTTVKTTGMASAASSTHRNSNQQ